MRKILIATICLGIGYLSASEVSKCDYLLKEGDIYLNRIPLCEESAERHAKIANAYYERYKICKKFVATDENLINNLKSFKTEREPFKCENHSKNKERMKNSFLKEKVSAIK